MITENKKMIIEGKEVSSDVSIFEDKDKQKIMEIFELWDELSIKLTELNCRRANFTEISEVIFCYVFNCWRTNNIKKNDFHTSFDCYNPKTKKTVQLKATSSINELSSFGPKSVWEELYFMDFYNEPNNKGKNNGNVKIYFIPNEEIYTCKMNKKETFRDQQKRGVRPRFSIRKKIIEHLNLEPIGEFNIYKL